MRKRTRVIHIVIISEEFIYEYFNTLLYIPAHFPVSDALNVLLLSLCPGFGWDRVISSPNSCCVLDLVGKEF